MSQIIPTVKEINEEEWRRLFVNLKRLKDDDSVLETLLNQMIPLVNNSVVGTSKILHVIYPSLIPIIDIGVVENWNLIISSKSELILPKAHLSSGDVQKKVAFF